MLFFILTLAIAYLTHPQPHQQCFSSCKYLPFSKCTICYTKCFNAQQKPTFFQMNHCEQIDEANTSQIDKWNQTQCAFSCCDDVSSGSFTSDTFDRCVLRDELQMEKSKTTAIIILSSIGGFLLLICACCLYRKCCRKSSEEEDNNDERNLQQFKEKQLVWKNLGDLRQTLKPLCNRQQNNRETCPICLDELCNCRTQCGHIYHIKCLTEWYKKDRTCPVCRSTKTKPLKILCTKCKEMYLSVASKEQFSKLKKLIKENKVNCGKCSIPEISKNESFEGGWVGMNNNG